MYKTRPNNWQTLCLKAMREMNPERRMAIVLELSRRLRNDVYNFGPLQIDIGGAEVTRNGKPVLLTHLEFKLLRHFIEQAGIVLSRNELLKVVWGYHSESLTRTVDVHVGSLRQKLEQDAKRPHLIITVKGIGYKFVEGAFER